jgi:hypothetical protein
MTGKSCLRNKWDAEIMEQACDEKYRTVYNKVHKSMTVWKNSEFSTATN